MATQLPPSTTLTDLVPLETLDTLRRLFRATVGVPMVFTDALGAPVTEVEDILLYCGTLVRDADCRSVCLRRKKWDVPEQDLEDFLRDKHAGTKPVAHRCLGGFQDTAVPIVVDGVTVGYAVFARSLPDAPDVEAYRQMAVAADMDPSVGEEVARRAVVMPSERIAQVAEFLQVIGNLVARAAHETIRARQVLELEKLRDDLTHMIVHDLRTPLTSIMGSLQTLADVDYEAEMTREFIPMALSSAEILLEMVNTLLDISKMESGQMKLNRTTVDLPEVAHRALDQVRGLAAEHGHELTEDLDPACPPLNADPELLRRVLVNLLGNAVKFTPDGGHVGLSSAWDAEGMTLTVEDDGPGIPEEYRGRIFEKFGQVESRSEGHKHSTGLGLTFCMMVAEAHGGRIWVESEVGKGSRFRVWLPADEGG